MTAPNPSIESDTVVAIAFGLVGSLLAMLALYFSYRQLRAVRHRKNHPKQYRDVEDVHLSGTVLDEYPLVASQHHNNRTATHAPTSSRYLVHLTRSRTVDQ